LRPRPCSIQYKPLLCYFQSYPVPFSKSPLFTSIYQVRQCHGFVEFSLCIFFLFGARGRVVG
jgi:hypothetical protein